jgi:hypothetical protein
VHPYRKWTGAHWRLVSLVELGIPAREPRAVRAAGTVLDWLTGEQHRASIIAIDGLSQAGFHGEFISGTICPRVRRTSSDAKTTEVPRGAVSAGRSSRVGVWPADLAYRPGYRSAGGADLRRTHLSWGDASLLSTHAGDPRRRRATRQKPVRPRTGRQAKLRVSPPPSESQTDEPDDTDRREPRFSLRRFARPTPVSEAGPAFVLARVHGGGARVAACVRKEQRSDGGRRGCSVTDGAVRRRARVASQLARFGRQRHFGLPAGSRARREHRRYRPRLSVLS